jgi:hypothetical protein
LGLVLSYADETEFVFNMTDLNFFVKMIGIESFKIPKNWSQNWTGSIKKKREKKYKMFLLKLRIGQ